MHAAAISQVSLGCVQECKHSYLGARAAYVIDRPLFPEITLIYSRPVSSCFRSVYYDGELTSNFEYKIVFLHPERANARTQNIVIGRSVVARGDVCNSVEEAVGGENGGKEEQDISRITIVLRT